LEGGGTIAADRWRAALSQHCVIYCDDLIMGEILGRVIIVPALIVLAASIQLNPPDALNDANFSDTSALVLQWAWK
jgi:hypothetical protein